MTVAAIIQQVLSLAFPRRVAPSLVNLKQHLVIQGMIDIQRYIPSFQEGNVEITDGTFDLNVSGATLINAPDGEIKQVAVGSNDYGTIHATLVDWRHMQKLQKQFEDAYGFGSADEPPAYPTSRVYYARDENDLLIYPWVPPGWMAGVRWRGIDRNLTDAKEVWWGSRAIECLRLHAIAYDRVGCDDFSTLVALYRDELAKLKFEEFRKNHPTQYDPYQQDVLWPARCSTTDADSATTGAGTA